MKSGLGQQANQPSVVPPAVDRCVRFLALTAFFN